jgi:hypothetical protein
VKKKFSESVKKGKLNCRGEMGGNFLVDTGFIYMIQASVTAPLLKYVIKGRCICGVD